MGHVREVAKIIAKSSKTRQQTVAMLCELHEYDSDILPKHIRDYSEEHSNYRRLAGEEARMATLESIASLAGEVFKAVDVSRRNRPDKAHCIDMPVNELLSTENETASVVHLEFEVFSVRRPAIYLIQLNESNPLSAQYEIMAWAKPQRRFERIVLSRYDGLWLGQMSWGQQIRPLKERYAKQICGQLDNLDSSHAHGIELDHPPFEECRSCHGGRPTPACSHICHDFRDLGIPATTMTHFQ